VSTGTETGTGAGTETDTLDAYSRAVIRVAEELLPSVASIRVHGRGRPDVTARAYGSGSAVAVSPDGFLVTSAHVVAGSHGGVAAFGDGRELPFEIVGTDRLSDLAVIRTTGGELHPARLGDADTLRVGQLVVAVGNPLGFAGSVSAGVVSALGRSFATSDGRHARIVENVIQTDASLHPGNSGGALATSAVEVVGINTAVVGPGIGQGLGLAVPVNATTTGIMAALMAERRVRRAYLGVGGGSRPLPPRVVQALAREHPGQEHGIEVTSVVSGSPAGAAGIRPEDLIVAVDGTPVRSIGDLQRLMTADRIGRPVQFRVVRGSDSAEVTITPIELEE
jgi:S1-C subfamily serine protease